MDKDYAFIEGTDLRDVVALALDDDQGTRTCEHRFFEEPHRLWILRESLLNPSNRFIECFEFAETPDGVWGLRAWSEEEGIPYLDCPLELLAKATCAIDAEWRDAVTSTQACEYAMPRGCWLHSSTGIVLSNGERCHDFRFHGGDNFSCPAGEMWQLAPELVSVMAKEGCGIAAGRA